MTDTTTESATTTTPGTPAADAAGATAATTATTDSALTTASTTGEVAGGADTTDTTTATGAPAAYKAFQVPDGYTLAGDRLAALQEFARANNWTQAQAQAAVDRYIELDQQGHLATREQRVEAWTEQSRTEYGDRLEAIANDARAGVKWAEQHRPNILKTFDDEGWGSHPDALWVFAKLGELTRGGRLEGLGNDTTNAPTYLPPEARLWPTQK